jgi:hypothetical protein
MGARQPKLRSPRKPRLTRTRYKQMLHELEHLSKKYQGDLDKIIPSVSRFIAEAQERVQRFQDVPQAGAPTLWIQGQLVRLLRLVCAIRILDPKLDDREACRLLAAEGFWVFAHDPYAVVVEDFCVLITNPNTLRRRLADARKSLEGYVATIQLIEQEANDLAKDERLKSLLRGPIEFSKASQGVRGI